jgi:hypothetical protein
MAWLDSHNYCPRPHRPIVTGAIVTRTSGLLEADRRACTPLHSFPTSISQSSTLGNHYYEHRALRHDHHDTVLSSPAIWHLLQSLIVMAILLLDTTSDMKQVLTSNCSSTVHSPRDKRMKLSVQGAQTQKSLVWLATPAFNVGLQLSASHEMEAPPSPSLVQ